MTSAPPESEPLHQTHLGEVTALFLRLGFTAFGGPAAHIALMEREVVHRRGWLTHQAFLDLLGATNLIPGPSSTQMAMNLAYARAGWRGLLLGGLCFIGPAVLITVTLAWAYVRFGRLPQALGLLYGIKPIVLAIVFQAAWSLGKTAFRTRLLKGLGLVALALSLLGLPPLVILLGAGLAALGAEPARGKGLPQVGLGGLVLPLSTAALPTVGLVSLFLFFLKLGAVLFGSGYVLLAFLKADLVDRWHWLTQAQLLDAVAVGQITPGPVFTTATFIGYVLKGFPGALVATVGIFLPSFFFVGLLGILVPKLRQSNLTAAFLDGVNVGALALLVAVVGALSRTSLVDGWTILLGLGSAALLLRFKVNPTWLVLGGGVAGMALATFR